MQLARRGGMSGLPIILPGKVDGYVQAIRDKNISPDAQVGDPSFSFVNAGLGVGCQSVQVDSNHETVEIDMELMSYAGFSADAPLSCTKIPVINEDIPVFKKGWRFSSVKIMC